MIRFDWPDEELARRLYQHDPDALETLRSRYERPLSDWIRAVLSGVEVAQDVEECVNELFVVPWQEMEIFDETQGTLRTWLTKRARDIALVRRRRRLQERRRGRME